MDEAKRETEAAAANAADAARRRPQPILDLKATEVGGGGAASAGETPDPAASDSGKAGAAPGSFADGAVPPGGPKATTNDAPAKAPPATTARPARWLAAAALAGAVTGVAAAFATVWMLGFMTRADESSARIAQLETQLRTLAARPVADPGSIKAVGDRVAAGEQALQATTVLQRRIAEVETALKQPPATSAAAPDERVGKLDAAAQSLGGEVADLRKRLDDIAAAARTARDTAVRTAGSSTAAVAISTEEIETLAKRVQALEATAKSLQAKLDAPPPDRDRAARFAAATLALRGAVERGDAYEGELAAARALLDDPVRLKPLEGAAANGIAGARELARDLSRLIVGIRQSAEAGQEAGDGLIGRLQASASKLVRIRPVGEEGAAGEADALAVVEERAARTDIAGALAEAEKLPQDLRAPLADWIAKARTRVAALGAARALAREGLAALGAGMPARP